jgi:hypothetical protein
VGVSDLRDLHWASETRWGGFPLALKDDVAATFTLDGTDQDAWIDAIVPAWGQIAAAFGLDTPPRDILLRQMGRG